MRDELKVFAAGVGRAFAPPDPIVEIGSLQTPGQVGYADLRPDFAGRDYIGCDIVEGPGVDRIEDVRAMRFADGGVGALVAMDSLEHVADPQRAVAEMHRVIAPGGVVAIGVPFIFPIHHHPDFTRFTPEGLYRLLGAFARVAVFAVGDAQWPHSVVALATHAMEAGEFESRVAAVTEHWDASGLPEPLHRFQPVESVLRRDHVYAVPIPLDAGVPLEEVVTCPRAGLCRVDVRLGLPDPDARPDHVALTLTPEDGQGAPAAARVSGATLAAPRWTSFTMPALTDSADRTYRLRLEAVGGRSDLLGLPDHGIALELYVSRPVVPLPDTSAPPGGDPATLRTRIAALEAEVRRLETQAEALRAAAARPWWARLLGRGGPTD